MGWALIIFQYRVTQRITGRHPTQRGEGRWEYPPPEAATEEAVFEDIGVYITMRQNMVAQYIVTQPIIDLYERSIWRLLALVSWRWWEQEVLDPKGEV